jgi:hypothetical protein
MLLGPRALSLEHNRQPKKNRDWPPAFSLVTNPRRMSRDLRRGNAYKY